MKAIHLFLAAATILGMLSCSNQPAAVDTVKIKADIEKAEKDFEKMAAEKGIAEAFWYFAADSAVIKRENDTLIIGKENIRNYYSAPFYKNAKVKWAPDFVAVSDHGDMAWTYGKYDWQSTDSAGKTASFNGIFHTVWKKQADGSWKYTWD
jgi:ketosteroid isomerase-like protein